MGVINPEKIIRYKSAGPLFDRVKKKLESFDAAGLIDEGDFGKATVYILSQLGESAMMECEAVIPIKDYQGVLPLNFKTLHGAWRCGPANPMTTTKSINEQIPYIYYVDNEFTQVCPRDCCVECVEEPAGKTKIVVRTYVNGAEDSYCAYRNPVLLKVSPNVRNRCSKDSPGLFCSGYDEITFDDDGVIRVNFEHAPVYLQYFGVPIDQNNLPMVPDQEDVEMAIEYYLISTVLESAYFNSTMPDIANKFQYAQSKADFHLGQARYWAKLPSFQRMLQSIRRQRGRNSFYYFRNDKTFARMGGAGIVNSGLYTNTNFPFSQ